MGIGTGDEWRVTLCQKTREKVIYNVLLTVLEAGWSNLEGLSSDKGLLAASSHGERERYKERVRETAFTVSPLPQQQN